jgi:AraC family transcriptional regulator
MKKDSLSNLAGIARVRASIGSWPISTTGMSSTTRGLYFDVREASHGVELIVPACDHHAASFSTERRCEFHSQRSVVVRRLIRRRSAEPLYRFPEVSR